MRPAIDREGEFERFLDEGASVSQKDVFELQGNQAQRGGPSDLLQDAEAQAETRLKPGVDTTMPRIFLRLHETEGFVDQRQG